MELKSLVGRVLPIMAGLLASASAWSAGPLLMRNPSLGDKIAFSMQTMCGRWRARAAMRGG